MVIKDSHILALLFFGLGIQILMSTVLPISLSPNSFQYIILSNSPFNISVFDNRTMGYPLFIAIFRLLEFIKINTGVYFVICVQNLFAISIPIIIYLSFKIYDLFIAKIFSFFFCIFLYPYWMSHQIMTETIFIFSLSLLILGSNYYFFNNINNLKNQKKSLFVFVFVFIISILIRPSVQLLVYFLPFIFLLYFIKNRKKEIAYKFLITIFSFIIILFCYNILSTKASKGFSLFLLWHQTSTELCEIKDISKINFIKDNNVFKVPDKKNRLIIEKKFEDLNENDKKYMFTEKCIKYGNGPKTNKYFEEVAKFIDADKVFKKTITSTYNDFGAPDKLDDDLQNLSSLEIIKKVHNKYRNPIPFMHIYWNLSATKGFQSTSKLLSAVLLETYLNKKQLLWQRIEQKISSSNIFSLDLLISQGITQSKLDMAYFRFIPTPYKDLKDQGLLLWYDIPPKMYLQNLNTIEKLSGNDINNLYNKKHFYNLMENDYRSKNFEIIKNNLLNDKNISNFFIEIIYRVNFFTYFFVKIFIFICLPLVMIIFLLNYSLSIFTKKNIFEESLLLSSILMSLIGFGSIIVSLFLFYDERHIMMHLILFSPLTMYLFLKLKTFFKNKSQKNH